MRQYFITVFVIAVIAIGGFMLPSELMKWQDEKRLENSETQAAEEVILTAGTDMTLIEKIQLIQKSSVTALEMEQGKKYSRESIIPKAQKELQKLIDLEILDLDRLDYIYGIEQILFLVDTEDGTKSMILWTVSVITDNFFIGISMDDETGKILSIQQSDIWTASNNVMMDASEEFSVSEKRYLGDLEIVAEKWGKYLGVSLAETYDTPNPTADIDKEQDREIQALMKEGLTKEEAAQKVYEVWGIDAEESKNWLYGVYEDEGGITAYLFRKNMGDTVFSAEF